MAYSTIKYLPIRIEDINGDFLVSSLGSVVSATWPEREDTYKPLKQRSDGRGYLCVDIPRVNNKRPVTKKVHILVMEAFVGQTPKGYHIDHKDHDKTNNRIDNLRWREIGENSADCRRGSRKGCKHLSEEQKLAIESLTKDFWGVSFIRKATGISDSTIRRVQKQLGLR
ncbi:MAG: HNH endonuclease [Okeania sp. SIO3H1]|nr:HNH endonuclease [Okeania sp. SIO3H1]